LGVLSFGLLTPNTAMVDGENTCAGRSSSNHDQRSTLTKAVCMLVWVFTVFTVFTHTPPHLPYSIF
jgi:hypothetical protein